MKKSKIKSEASLLSSKNNVRENETPPPPLDTIEVNVLSLRLPEDPSTFAIKISFFDQLILSTVINSSNIRELNKVERTIAREEIRYDPSDYERMCLLADTPLVVTIQRIRLRSSTHSKLTSRSQMGHSQSFSRTSSNSSKLQITDTSCCNVDILPLFIDKETILVQKRMQPVPTPSVLQSKSWDNLPLLTMKLKAIRNIENKERHKTLKNANFMKLTLVGVFNTIIPYDDIFEFTAASIVPTSSKCDTGLIQFGQGCSQNKNFAYNCFYPEWESLKTGDDLVTTSDDKLVYTLEDLQNKDGIELQQYFDDSLNENFTSIIWGSFHRTLLLKGSEQWLWNHVKNYKWPLEVHMSDEEDTYIFMAFLDVNTLLYPGETTVLLAVPLQWMDAEQMLKNCRCEQLVPRRPDRKLITPAGPSSTTSKVTPDSTFASISTDAGASGYRSTGGSLSPAIVVVEVKLTRPLIYPVAPTVMTISDVDQMLHVMEEEFCKKVCTGRGQLERDWQATARAAVQSLQSVPYYGSTDLCAFNRQLSESRTRVELVTSFWKEAAIYMNNNFVVQECLKSNCSYEEVVMLAHACLMRSACEAMALKNQTEDFDPTIQAARHARQMRDNDHALDLYLRAVVEMPKNADYWRELSICLRDVDRDWANVCINKSVALNPRHPLSLLAKGCMVHEDDPAAAEPFFVAILVLHPFWLTGWVATSVYYFDRELFYMADQIIDFVNLTQEEGYLSVEERPRSWPYELGDWWDATPLYPDSSLYHDAADLLLRIRALKLAEICIARGQVDKGETAPYYHQMAICYRLREEYNEALCHARQGLEKFGEVCYLRAMEGECLYMMNDHAASMAAYEKALYCTGGYSLILSLPCREVPRGRAAIVELIRRQPSAYAWMALAEDWIKTSTNQGASDKAELEENTGEVACAIACAVQALKWDRRCAPAWALLCKLVKPSARRLFCRNKAIACGYVFTDDATESDRPSVQSLCHRLGTALRECRCESSEDVI